MQPNVSTTGKYLVSPCLAMQFMEPLGTGMIRWGGCFASCHRWRETVGPMEERRPKLNLCRDGLYSIRVGTKEFAAFCLPPAAVAVLEIPLVPKTDLCDKEEV